MSMKFSAIVNGLLNYRYASAQAATGPGTDVVSDNTGVLSIAEAHGRYYVPTYYGFSFNAANQAGQVTTASLAAGALTGLCISNPIGNKYNVVLNKVGYAVDVPSALMSISLATGFSSATNVTHTTALTPQSSLIGSGVTPTAKVDSSFTTPSAAVVTTVFGYEGTVATTSLGETSAIIDLEGSIILSPGAFAYIYTSGISGTGGLWGSFSWEEVPI